MDSRNSHQTSRAHEGNNYWQRLAAAVDALAVGDFPAAERRYHDACDQRAASPGRVFLTEKIGDGLRRLVGRRNRPRPAGRRLGRWSRASRTFVNEFQAAGERVVREGVRLADLRPEDDAEANQPILESALFLVARSRIFPDEPASAVPLLRGVFRTAVRTGRPFSVDLVRHDLPLTEEDRLWMARKGSELVASFVEQGHLRQGAPEAAEWAEVFLQLLQARYFGTTGRLREERAWLEAVTADRLLGRASASVDLYRAYLEVNPEPGSRPDEARVRLLELLGNTHHMNFAVPRYAAALGAMQSAGLASGSTVAGRFEEALARLEFRRPEPAAGSASAAWASVAVEPDGRIAVVFWWDNEPRDLALWTPGSDPSQLEAFLQPCAGRLLAADGTAQAACAGQWADPPAPWTAQDFVAAVLESRLPAGGLEPGALSRLALAESSAWRSGWRADRGHPALVPPHSSSLVDAWQQTPAVGAVQAGLLFLAVRNRIGSADMCLRAGIGEMARRGDAAARFLYEFLILDSAAARAVDASFEAWTLPLLWTRPDPFGWRAGDGADAADDVVEDHGLRPDLRRNDLAIVTTGNPLSVLAAWGDSRQKWRLVLDRMDRLSRLTKIAGGLMGPVTFIPAAGTVHELAAALALLEELIRTPAAGTDGLLALFHWTRLVETHNGDLLDFRQVRPRTGRPVPLYERYAEVVSGLGRQEPSLSADGTLDSDTLGSWGGQFSQRVRKAGLVAGTADHLSGDERTLDSLWGVFEGSDAAWVFLDSAAVHWTLLQSGARDIGQLHAVLHSRGRRHLSLLSAAAWQRTELEELLAGWLQVFGSAYCLSLTDTHAPALRLVDRGSQPASPVAGAAALAGQLAWIERRFADEGPGTVLLPASGPPADFWNDVRSGALQVGGAGWHYLAAGGGADDLPDAALVVPVLGALEGESVPVARADSRAAWSECDRARAAHLDRCRRLCALEIAALMAGRWRSVDILDARWWRLLRPVAPTGGPTVRWHGEPAAALATDGVGRTFDLPGSGVLADRPGPVDKRILGAVQHWQAGRENAAPGADTPGPDGAPEAGTHLIVGELTSAWEGLRRHLERAWAAGDLSQWVLVVADVVPPGAAELVGAGWVAGASVWNGAATAALPAPVMWVGPEDLAEAPLRQLLAEHPPWAIVADDLSDWLPTATHDAQEAAVALRAILDIGARTKLLRARALEPSWIDFLAESCGARVARPGAVPETVAGPAAAPRTPAAACLDCGFAGRPAALAHRLRLLLSRIRSVLADVDGEAGDPPGEPVAAHERRLLPVDWLGRLAGLTRSEVSEGVLLLRWAARLHGDSLSAAGDASGAGEDCGHTLVIARRYSEMERMFDRLGENLAVLMPLWLAETNAPGQRGQIDLEQPPARIDPRELALVDAFLSAVADGPSYDTGLVYRCPRGLLNSTTRLVGLDRAASETGPALRRVLSVFRDRVREVLATAVETGEGFRVATGLSELRDEERDFMGLGVALGLWQWQGPPGPGGLHLVDLLTVADSATVRQSPLGWRLFMAQAASRFPVPVEHLPVPVSAQGASARPLLGPLRRLLNAGLETSDDLDAVVARVHEVTGRSGEPNLLVLKGMQGTGRHEALFRGLNRTLHAADDPGDVVIYCPDEAVAAMVSRECVQHGYGRALDVRIPATGRQMPAAPQALPALAAPELTVVVMCEVQRFDPETRYRVAQMGRGKRLVITADAAASAEPWEHLFLTTPRANDIVEMTGQRRLSKSIWAEVRALAGGGLQVRGRTRRHGRGRLESGYAANLVQSLARVLAARQEGVLPAPLRLTAPLPADLDYLGTQLRDRGWLAVPERELDGLLLPGPSMLLAAATDRLARNGDLALAFDAAVASEPERRPDRDQIPGRGGADGTADTPAPADPPAPGLRSVGPLTPHLLGPQAGLDYETWWERDDSDSDTTLAAFFARLANTAWAGTVLRHAAARRRCARLLAVWGEQELSRLLQEPLWETWWHTLAADAGLVSTAERRPIVLLSDSARLPGCRVPGGAYLCLGTEPASQHYEVLSRIADGAIVLYQERSPLPSEAPD